METAKNGLGLPAPHGESIEIWGRCLNVMCREACHLFPRSSQNSRLKRRLAILCAAPRLAFPLPLRCLDTFPDPALPAPLEPPLPHTHKTPLAHVCESGHRVLPCACQCAPRWEHPASQVCAWGHRTRLSTHTAHRNSCYDDYAVMRSSVCRPVNYSHSCPPV